MIILLVTALPAAAQTTEFGVASSPNVVGSGARALGVGGAFIAIADDATAASWNPAALIVLERPEAAIMGSYERRRRFGDASFTDFNYLAVSYPFTALNRNMIVSFNYQRLFDFNSEFNRTFEDFIVPQFRPSVPVFEFTDAGGWDVYTITTSTIIVNELTINDETTGDIGAFAPAFAIQITPSLSFGLTVNFWTDGIVNDGYSRTYQESQNGSARTDVVIWFDTDGDTVTDYTEWSDLNGDTMPNPGEGEIITSPGVAKLFASTTTIDWDYKLFGVNANLGALWNVTPKITLGAVYKLPFTASMDVDVNIRSRDVQFDPGTGAFLIGISEDETSSRFDIKFPPVYGLGLAYRFNDNFTMALDVSYTEWGDYKIQERAETGGRSPTGGPFGMGGDRLLATGARKNGVTGLNVDGYCDARDGPQNCIPGVSSNWHSDVDVPGVFTARLGAEYLFIRPKTIIPVRAGFVYDPEPALNNPDDYYAVSGGTGIVLWKRYIFDIAYQYRWSDSATLATVTSFDGRILMREVTGEVTQHQLLLSSIVHF